MILIYCEVRFGHAMFVVTSKETRNACSVLTCMRVISILVSHLSFNLNRQWIYKLLFGISRTIFIHQKLVLCLLLFWWRFHVYNDIICTSALRLYMEYNIVCVARLMTNHHNVCYKQRSLTRSDYNKFLAPKCCRLWWYIAQFYYFNPI